MLARSRTSATSSWDEDGLIGCCPARHGASCRPCPPFSVWSSAILNVGGSRTRVIRVAADRGLALASGIGLPRGWCCLQQVWSHARGLSCWGFYFRLSASTPLPYGHVRYHVREHSWDAHRLAWFLPPRLVLAASLRARRFAWCSSPRLVLVPSAGLIASLGAHRLAWRAWPLTRCSLPRPVLVASLDAHRLA